ncbi:MAG TPA: biotin--[acetyl-CoA-carboxylase] ligase, partial [Cellvibrionaceae bacterium]|nr:biotin--[acetyl-CoA-carboxylase] ligase [Cellvibrionaceae bacterium]
VSRQGRGYCWDGATDLLSQAAITGALSEPVAVMLEVLWQTASTNSLLLEAARSGSIHRRVILAEQQTGGRGRRGRTWVSPLAQNLYLSLGWHFEAGIAQVEGLSLAVGVVVVQSLQALGIEGLSLKWPNDIWLHGRKLAGVLIEVGGDLSGQFHLVLGLGLNSHMPVEEASAQGWASLLEQRVLSRNLLAARLIDALSQLLEVFAARGFVYYQQEWNRLNGLADCAVLIDQAGTLEEGVCIAAAPNGGLQVRTSTGLKTLLGGEISLRLQPNRV